jgi:hypothetical protein
MKGLVTGPSHALPGQSSPARRSTGLESGNRQTRSRSEIEDRNDGTAARRHQLARRKATRGTAELLRDKFASFRHLMLKRTGTVKDSARPGVSPGGFGIGWARASISRVSWSSAGEPELCTIALRSKWPS